MDEQTDEAWERAAKAAWMRAKTRKREWGEIGARERQDWLAMTQAAWPLLVKETERLRTWLKLADRQIQEFRRECDPREEVVQVTNFEMVGAAAVIAALDSMSDLSSNDG